MELLEELEDLRDTMNILQSFEKIIAEKKSAAIFGSGHRYNDIKVQRTKKHDAMEDAIIDFQEFEEKKHELFLEYMDRYRKLSLVVDEHCTNGKYLDLIHKYYFQNINIEFIPGCTIGKIKKAVLHVENNIMHKEEVNRQPEHIQKLIRGAKLKCRHCESGFVWYTKEEKDRFIFVCDGCGRRLKADKIGAQAKPTLQSE